MKVKVNIMNTLCITMPEAVTMPRMRMMVTSVVFEESLARDTQTQIDRQTDKQTLASSS